MKKRYLALLVVPLLLAATTTAPNFMKIWDGTETAGVTASNNFQVSVEELATGVSSNSGAQLNMTRFDSSGNETPAMDVVARAGFQKLTDGTNVADIVNHEDVNSLSIVVGHKETFIVHLDAESIGAPEGFMLVDLSDTGNWPHTNTGHIILEWMTINVNPATAFRGDVEIGFLDNVDATNGDLRIIHDFHFDQQAAEFSMAVMHDNHGLDLEISKWFGPTNANDVLWQTDVNLDGPDGANSYPSGDGDLVMSIVQTAGATDVGISIGYTTNN